MILNNRKIFISSYLVKGWFALMAGVFAYFAVLTDFGLTYAEVHGLLGRNMFIPRTGDEFDPSSPWLGNSLLKKLFPCNR